MEGAEKFLEGRPSSTSRGYTVEKALATLGDTPSGPGVVGKGGNHQLIVSKAPCPRSLLQVRAQVMGRDDSSGGWLPMEGGGLSLVTLHQWYEPGDGGAGAEGPGTYFITGQRISDNMDILKCPVERTMQYTRANPTFHHWRTADSRRFGLTFQSPHQASCFDVGVHQAIDELKEAAAAATSQGDQCAGLAVPRPHPTYSLPSYHSTTTLHSTVITSTRASITCSTYSTSTNKLATPGNETAWDKMHLQNLLIPQQCIEDSQPPSHNNNTDGVVMTADLTYISPRHHRRYVGSLLYHHQNQQQAPSFPGLHVHSLSTPYVLSGPPVQNGGGGGPGLGFKTPPRHLDTTTTSAFNTTTTTTNTCPSGNAPYLPPAIAPSATITHKSPSNLHFRSVGSYNGCGPNGNNLKSPPHQRTTPDCKKKYTTTATAKGVERDSRYLGKRDSTTITTSIPDGFDDPNQIWKLKGTGLPSLTKATNLSPYLDGGRTGSLYNNNHNNKRSYTTIATNKAGITVINTPLRTGDSSSNLIAVRTLQNASSSFVPTAPCKYCGEDVLLTNVTPLHGPKRDKRSSAFTLRKKGAGNNASPSSSTTVYTCRRPKGSSNNCNRIMGRKGKMRSIVNGQHQCKAAPPDAFIKFARTVTCLKCASCLLFTLTNDKWEDPCCPPFYSHPTNTGTVPPSSRVVYHDEACGGDTSSVGSGDDMGGGGATSSPYRRRTSSSAPPSSVFRWTLLGLLSLVLPCLCLYPLLKGCHRLGVWCGLCPGASHAPTTTSSGRPSSSISTSTTITIQP